MCGIVGAIGAENIVEKILEGLKKLEYRGYDSAGISVLDENKFKTVKQEGKIEKLVLAIKDSEIEEYFTNFDEFCEKFIAKNSNKNLKNASGDLLNFDAQKNIHHNNSVKSQKSQEKNAKKENLVAIGHTRWATHGRPSFENSHPHASSKICVVHNGIIENYQEIREKLRNLGANFLSETDSEVIPHLIEQNFNLAQKEFGDENFEFLAKNAIMKTLENIHGSYALAVMFRDYPDFILIAKKGSPLLVGFGKNCNYIASDYYALAKYTNEVIYLNDGEFAFIHKEKACFFDANGAEIQREKKIMESLNEKADKGDFEHFMLKEIYEQPQILSQIFQNYIDFDNQKIHLPNFPFKLNDFKKITIVACGTSYYAGLAAKYIFEEIAKIEVEVDIASEFRYRKNVFRDDNLMIFISQSGETADTIAALKYAKENNQKILSIVNAQNSSMEELSDAVLKILAGIEIGVASTKAYSAQIMVLSILALEFGDKKNILQDKKQILQKLFGISKKISQILQAENIERIKEVAKYLVDFRHILYIGRGVSYVSALEGALKFREISYIDAQAIAAGELKHGTIALIDEKMPVVAIAPNNDLFEKIASNIEEIKARRGIIIAVSDETGLENLANLADKKIEIVKTDSVIEEAIIAIIPLQILAYFVSLFKGNDVDQPRNLAKSVTVE